MKELKRNAQITVTNMPNSGYRGMINCSFSGHHQRPPLITPNVIVSAPKSNHRRSLSSTASPLHTPDYQRSLSSLSHSWTLLMKRRQYTQNEEEKRKKNKKVSFPPIAVSASVPLPAPKPAWLHVGKIDHKRPNSITPFSTLGKPTCGVFFSRETDNKKTRTGIPPSDLVKWRYFNEVSY